MRLAVNKEQIAEGLQKAAGIIPAKAGAAYLRSIWLKASKGSLAIMTTDADIEFTGRYPAEVEEEGLVGVQGRAFVDLVRQLPSGVISMSLDPQSGNLLLKQGRRNYKLPVSNPEWYQDVSPFPEDGAVRWAGDLFMDILEKVSFCIDDDDAKDAIACLYFKPGDNGRIEACGLNGHQFAMVSFINDELSAMLAPDGLLIQKKYLPDIKKWLGGDEIELNLTEKRLYLRRMDGAEMLSLPRFSHSYPDYNVFLSKFGENGEYAVLDLSRQEAMDALGRIQVFNKNVSFNFSGNEMSLSARGPENGSATETMEVEYDGSVPAITFPARNLLDIFGHFASGKVKMMLTGEEGPCGIKGDEDLDYIVIIMPMKPSTEIFYEEENM